MVKKKSIGRASSHRFWLALLSVMVLLVSVSAVSYAAPAEANGSYYVVQKGDTLYSIANRFGTTIASIMRANPQITNPDIIYAGATIFVPYPGPGGPGTGGPCRFVHYVRWGQTLSEIALHYRVQPQAIMQANGIQNPDLIYAGASLCIP